MDQKRKLATETSLYTRDVFQVLFEYEVSRSLRYPSPLTLLCISLETEGQSPESLQQARQALIEILEQHLRASDIPAYYGDDFVVLLPGTDELGGRAVAERILGRFRTTQKFTTERLTRMNVYIGLACRESGSSISAEQLLAEAMVAMNEARMRKSFTYLPFSEIADQLPRP
ncbi:MAG: GGDEF domain-containing protein [Anaerolineae bacterium]